MKDICNYRMVQKHQAHYVLLLTSLKYLNQFAQVLVHFFMFVNYLTLSGATGESQQLGFCCSDCLGNAA